MPLLKISGSDEIILTAKKHCGSDDGTYQDDAPSRDPTIECNLGSIIAGVLGSRSIIAGVCTLPEVGVELADPGATAEATQVESRQKPIRLIDERE